MARTVVEKNISYDNGRKCFYVCLDMGTDDTNRRYRQYRTYQTLDAAREALREHVLTQRKSESQTPVSKISVEEWLDEWMDTIIRPNRADTTAYSYEKIIENHLLPVFGSRFLDEVTPAEIQKYYVDVMREKGLCSNTVRRHHDLLAAAYRTAVRQGRILSSPLDRVEAPRVRQNETAFYNPAQLKELYRQVEGHRLEVAVHLAGSLGMRREELCGLKWKNVDLERRIVSIREARTCCGRTIVEKEPKNRSSTRTLFLSDDMLSLLRREKNRQATEVVRNPEGFVVLNRKGEPYSPNVLSLAFTRFLSARGLPRVTLHGLRHSFATIASLQGVTLFDIGKALGHSTPATTGRIYTHLVDRTHEDVMVKVSEALKPEKKGEKEKEEEKAQEKAQEQDQNQDQEKKE